jgi:2-polyprenyl-3-methyl-5-hydroxy-6-metoxy-1,4-benzoquinol methylase
VQSRDEIINKIEHIFNNLDSDKYPYIANRLGKMRKRFYVEKAVDYHEYINKLAKAEIKDSVILDAGCGPGKTSLILAMMGAKAIYGVDIMENRIEELQRFLEEYADNLPIKLQYANILKTGFEDSHFDYIFSLEALSHYIDPTGFLKEAHRMLKKDGKLLIADANNGANPILRFQRKILWWKREKGPQGNLIKRREIINNKYPILSDEELDRLSAGTACMPKEDVLEACEQYIETKKFPKNEYQWGKVSVCAESGYFDENVLYPYQLIEMLEQLGFEVEIYAFLGRRNKPVRMLNSFVLAITPLSIFFVTNFRIIARKR